MQQPFKLFGLSSSLSQLTIMELPKLKMYKDSEGHNTGYDNQELAKWMKERHFLKSWANWAMGSTGAIIDGHFIVYYWDVQRFLDGKQNLD